MAVYTVLDAAGAAQVLGFFGLGPPESLEPIAAGIENTSYRVGAGGREWVLTVFERDGPEAVAQTLALVEELSRRGVPCPAPRRGAVGPVALVEGKPAALVPFVAGVEVARPDEPRLEALGRCVAFLHRAAGDVPFDRDGAHLARVLAPLARGIAARLQERDPATARLLREEAEAQQAVPEDGLPSGVIHGDLFLDNVLFDPAVPEVRALLDFQMAGRGPWIYDAAVVLLDAAWADGFVSGDAARAFLRGYRAVRPLEGAEYAWLPWYLRRASLRFLCLRLQRFTLDGSGMRAGKAKDPSEYADRLRALRRGAAGRAA